MSVITRMSVSILTSALTLMFSFYFASAEEEVWTTPEKSPPPATCFKDPCAYPTCFGSQFLTVQTDQCGRQQLKCGCERKCLDVYEPLCDEDGTLHKNWCEFGIKACKLEEKLRILKIAPLSLCQGKGYGELRDYGAAWRRFWWFDAGLSNGSWPAGETDVLSRPFGDCRPEAGHCFGRLPEHLRPESTLLLAVDGVGNAFRWKFDAANPTAAAAWRAFHDHAETAAGAVVNSQKWNPDVMAGSLSAKFRDQDSFMYRDQYGVKSLLLDDDNCDCLSTLSMGSGMCLEGQQTRYGPARVFGVDNLNDPGCDTPTPEKSLSLYFSEN